MASIPTDATARAHPTQARCVRRTLTIGRPALELHRLWLEPAVQQTVMAHLAEVSLDDQGRWQWKARVPVAGELEWSSHVVEDLPGHRIVWQSLDDAELPNRGELVFHAAPADRGTEVTLTWRFDPPGGKLGELVARWLHAPEVAVSLALRRFKSLVETGEVPTLAHNPAARRDPDPYGAFE